MTCAAPTVSADSINLPASNTFSITALSFDPSKNSASTSFKTSSIDTLVLSTVVSSITSIPGLEASTKYNSPDLFARR